jgi:predicted site-specific integrase-resolvase
MQKRIKSKLHTAHEIAASPRLYNGAYKYGKSEWECMGYSKTGRTILFARLVSTKNDKLRQINTYLKPDTLLTVKDKL